MDLTDIQNLSGYLPVSELRGCGYGCMAKICGEGRNLDDSLVYVQDPWEVPDCEVSTRASASGEVEPETHGDDAA